MAVAPPSMTIDTQMVDPTQAIQLQDIKCLDNRYKAPGYALVRQAEQAALRIARLAEARKMPAIAELPFCNYFTYSWKSESPGLLQEGKKLSERYACLLFSTAIKNRFNHITTFAQHFADARQLEAICKQRQLLWELTVLIETNPIEESVTEIQNRLVALSSDNAPCVVSVATAHGTYSTFSFPGGCWGSSGETAHFLLYEIRRDATDNYFFVIHDRDPLKGGTCAEFQSGIAYLSQEGKKYKKTSFVIKTALHTVIDKEFLTFLLVTKYMGQNIEEVYSGVKRYLQEATVAKFPLVVSRTEQQVIDYRRQMISLDKATEMIDAKNSEVLKQLGQQKMALRDARLLLEEQLMQEDPSFHSLDIYGTTSESCLTGPEKLMASAQLRRIIKRDGVRSLAEALKNAQNLSPTLQEDKALLLEHSRWRLNQLETKITANQQRPDKTE